MADSVRSVGLREYIWEQRAETVLLELNRIPARRIHAGGRRVLMCYNCGCGMPNNDMGKSANITNKTFEEAAKTMGQSSEDAKSNAYKLLVKVLAAKEERQDKDWRP